MLSYCAHYINPCIYPPVVFPHIYISHFNSRPIFNLVSVVLHCHVLSSNLPKVPNLYKGYFATAAEADGALDNSGWPRVATAVVE